MGDSSRRTSEVYAPTLQRSGERAADESPPYPAGTVVGGKYRLETVLGQGGMGRVYAATHIGLERRVAVKVLLRRYADQPAMVERFRTEARSQSRISHPHVVPVFDYGTTDAGEAFLAMDLLVGEALSEVVRRGPMALDCVLAILTQVAMALRAAHAAGVVHRNLKPANVFLVRSGANEPLRVQVLDFGMAKLVEESKDAAGGLTAAGEILGTPEYMAPEQAVSGEINRRTDVYAFGCLAFELWCGHPPFTGANYVTILAKQLDEKPPRIGERRDAPATLEALVARALSKGKKDRPADMDEVLEALRSVSREEGLPSLQMPTLPEAQPMDDTAPMTKASRLSTRRGLFMRRRTRRVALALALLSVGAAAGAGAWRQLGPRRAATGTSTLVVDTHPPAAQLVVDGTAVAERTPAVAELAPGHHRIEVKLPHFKTQVIERDIKPAVSDVLRLTLARDTHQLHVTSEPPGAALSFDGFNAGITPTDVEVDPLESHTLRLERLGRKPWEMLLGEGDQRTSVSAELKKKGPADAD